MQVFNNQFFLYFLYKKKFFFFQDDNTIWECNFEKDDCGLIKDSPSYLNVFKFVRGNSFFNDFRDKDGNETKKMCLFFSFLIVIQEVIFIQNLKEEMRKLQKYFHQKSQSIKQ